MGKLFGTDGVRGVAGKDLTCELALLIGRGTAAVLTGLLLRKKSLSPSAPVPAMEPLPFSAALPQAVRQAVSSALSV